MSRKRLSDKYTKITLEDIESMWQKLKDDNTCTQCGTVGLYYDGSDTILKCIMCGSRYEKDFPKRPANYTICTVCGCFFKSRSDFNVCNECLVLFVEIKSTNGGRSTFKLILAAQKCLMCNEEFTPQHSTDKYCDTCQIVHLEQQKIKNGGRKIRAQNKQLKPLQTL